MQPLVSIGMPVFNCQNTIKSAVQSILNQSYKNWELFLIDDGSTDSTLSLLKELEDSRIKVIAGEKNLGLAARLNQAISLSNGKYFARMDGDDLAYPERFETQVNYLESHREVDLVASKVMVFNAEGIALGSYPFRQSHSEICSRPRSGFYMVHPTWMGKNEWFRKNLYDEKIFRCEDQELLLRSYENSYFACVPEILLGYREASLSLKKIYGSRYYYGAALIKKTLKNQNYYFLILGLTVQLLKGLVDTFAITTGLNYKILRHRINPVSQVEIDRWREVWSALEEQTKPK